MPTLSGARCLEVAMLLLPMAHVPWGGGGRACGVKVLMLSNLVKSRVTALLPRWVEGEGGGEG